MHKQAGVTFLLILVISWGMRPQVFLANARCFFDTLELSVSIQIANRSYAYLAANYSSTIYQLFYMSGNAPTT
jgi:hypothetical protein